MSGKQRSEKDCDVSLFDTLYRNHHRVVHAFLVGQCTQPDSAADLLQETFLRVWRHIGTARGIPADRLRYWLFAIARNVATDDCRRRAVRHSVECDLALTDSRSAGPATDPAASYLQRESAREAEAAILRLPEGLRTALTMSLLSGLTSREIGEALGVPAGTVRYRVAQARARLAQDLGVRAP